MTDTVLSSATKEVVIGFGRPFVIIGERINPTGRKILAAEMVAGNMSRVESDAIAQVEAGAHMLDVNAGIPLADEPAILARTIQLVQSITDVPLTIDSSIVDALEAGLAVYQGKALVNSVTGEDEQLERVLPLVKKYGAAVVGRQVMQLVRRLRDELKVNTTCGASNVSFGLPNRNGINAAFLPMAMAAGMTSAITNPLHTEVVQAVLGADVMMGHDPDCRRWIAKYRQPTAVGAEPSRRDRARRRRRA
jgi:5-methyltetrahydrofolate--homocysteine methyltransferase